MFYSILFHLHKTCHKEEDLVVEGSQVCYSLFLLLSMLLRAMAGSEVEVLGDMGFLNCVRQWTTLERHSQVLPECVGMVRMVDHLQGG